MSRVWKFGDNISTDDIIPGKYYPREDVVSLGNFCMIHLRPEFREKKRPGDVIVAGENFGCGSSREHAVLALKYSGLKCVIAKSFARIFFRNSINLGYPIMMCKDADKIHDQEQVDVDLRSGEIKTESHTFRSVEYPDFIQNIIKEGGIINYIKKKNETQNMCD